MVNLIVRKRCILVFFLASMVGILPAEEKHPLQNCSTIALSHFSTALNHSTIAPSYSSTEQAPSHNSTILIFVSFSMPDQSLKQYAIQAKKAGASLVLRGLIENSMRKTTLRLQKIVQETQASFLIDPTAFHRFGIQKVPAVVVISNEIRTTKTENRVFDVVYGLTTLDYALEKIARDGEASSSAETALKALRGAS